MTHSSNLFKKIRIKLAHVIARDYMRKVDDRVNQRVADALMRMDPFEPVMKKFHGIFGRDFEHPEERLDQKGQLLMKTLGYQLRDDPSFRFLTEWVMNTQGNAMLKLSTRTNEERGEVLLWGKAQISAMILFVKEVGRLASLYEELLAKQKEGDFTSDNTVE